MHVFSLGFWGRGEETGKKKTQTPLSLPSHYHASDKTAAACLVVRVNYDAWMAERVSGQGTGRKGPV